jgi:nitrous oxidase accessory protein
VADGEVLIHGGGRGTVVTVSSPDVTLRGFRISASGGQGEDAAGVKVLGVERVSLEDLVVEDTFTGIAAFGSTDLTLTGNEIAGSGQTAAGADHATSAEAPVSPSPTPNPLTSPAPSDPHADHAAGAGPQGQGDGISLWAVHGVLLRDNVVHDVRDGFYLNYTDDVLLDTNVVVRSRYAVHVMFGNGVTVFGNDLSDNLSGLVFMYTAGALVGRNTIVDHRSPGTGFGVVTKDVVGLRMAENVIARNRVGFRAEATAHQPGAPAEVLRNRFSGNDAAVSLMSSADIGFGANVFEDNLIQVLAPDRGTERRNQWTYQGTGNSWSDYRGYDLAQDGTGDVAYIAYGTAELLVAADPALQAFVTAPAYEIYARAQQMWASGRDPMIVDHAPLTRDTAPPLTAGRQSGSPLAWWLAGAVLLLAGVLGRFGSAAVPRLVRERVTGGLSRV